MQKKNHHQWYTVKNCAGKDKKTLGSYRALILRRNSLQQNKKISWYAKRMKYTLYTICDGKTLNCFIKENVVFMD